MKKYLLVVLFVMELQLCQGQTVMHDFFPLVIGNTWVYEYDRGEWSYNLGLSSRKTRSGTIVLTVFDSMMVKPDSIVWTFVSYDSALLRAVDYDYSGIPVNTVETQIRDTSTFTMSENTIGMHLLKSGGLDSYQPLFRFPQTWSVRNPGNWIYGPVSIGKPMYRYRSDTAAYKLTFDQIQTNYVNDTVLFMANQGVIWINHRERTGGSSGHSQTNTHFKATLIGSKITVPPSPQDTTKHDTTKVKNPTLPTELALDAGFPNPFSSEVSLTFDIPAAMNVSLKVYNTFGQEVATILDQYLEAGVYSRTWVPANTPSGFYLCQLNAGSVTKNTSLVYLK